jgi:mono/diheme cytochrome c family protein
LLLPVTLVWYLNAASEAGVPVGKILGLPEGLLGAQLITGETGYPVAQTATVITLAAAMLAALLSFCCTWLKPRWLNKGTATLILMAGLCAFGAGEFVREGLRKPYVLGQLMFVNSVHLPVPALSAHESRFAIPRLMKSGVLKASAWITPEESAVSAGAQVFRLLCSTCHTVDGYMGIRALVEGRQESSLYTLLGELARPVDDEGMEASWDTPGFRLETWRGRRMPPFAGSLEERRWLAAYLASLSETISTPTTSVGHKLFEERCIFCHGSEADWPMGGLTSARGADEFYERIGDLPSINPIMPPFEGTDDDRRRLAEYLADLVAEPAAKEQE